MEWRPATDGDGEVLADLALGCTGASAIEQIGSLLKVRRIELGVEHGRGYRGGRRFAAVAVTSSRIRSLDRGDDDQELFDQIIG